MNGAAVSGSLRTAPGAEQAQTEAQKFWQDQEVRNVQDNRRKFCIEYASKISCPGDAAALIRNAKEIEAYLSAPATGT